MRCVPSPNVKINRPILSRVDNNNRTSWSQEKTIIDNIWSWHVSLCWMGINSFWLFTTSRSIGVWNIFQSKQTADLIFILGSFPFRIIYLDDVILLQNMEGPDADGSILSQFRQGRREGTLLIDLATIAGTLSAHTFSCRIIIKKGTWQQKKERRVCCSLSTSLFTQTHTDKKIYNGHL